MAELQQKAWYLGNTTIRNPSRLKEGLRALLNSPLHGNLIGRKNEQAFAKLLNQEGVVLVKRLQPSHNYEYTDVDVKDASDVGRKWRAALMQLGFITPGPELSDQPYTITSNGQRLLKATTLPEEQDCFLRALLALQLPSQIEEYIEVPLFSPLRIVLEILAGLVRQGLDPGISLDEMAAIVQLITQTEDVPDAVQRIAKYREAVRNAEHAKRFVKEHRDDIAREIQTKKRVRQSGGTLKDYADSNFRYLKLTGLFAETGRRLRFADYKQTIIQQILSTPYKPIPLDKYLGTLWHGARLPTDNVNKAIEAIESTASLLRSMVGAEHTEGLIQLQDISDLALLKDADLARLRLKLENDLLKLFEARFAEQQKEKWEDIIQYLHALMRPNRRGIIPEAEAPAYFEWALWRAFLAINSLVSKPWDARRFKIDQEFKPVSPAASGGPDMIFEFEDFVIVVEVTLTTSSRQEAAEGEPVRRHVAAQVDFYASKGKRVYGLFIANKIDTNTAETFRNGSWYRMDDSRMELQIVPFTLKQFTDLFEVGFQGTANLDYRTLETIITQCVQAKSNADAPQWKRRIGERISVVVEGMSQ